MSRRWPRQTVLDLQSIGVLLVEDGNHGEYRPRPHEFVDEGVSFIRAADMIDGRVDFGRASRINEAADARIRKGRGMPGDVLLSHKGTVGKVALVASDAPSFVCSPQTTFYRSLSATKLDRRYLFYFLKSPEFVDQLSARKGETDMADYVSLTEQRRLCIAVPRLDVQRGIAGVLGALDDLIDTNRTTASRLRSAVRTEFDRVVGRSGKPAVAGEVLDLKYGKSLPARSRRSGSVPVVSSAGIVDHHDESLVAGPGVVVGRKGTVGSVTWVPTDFFPIDTAFYVETNLPMLFALLSLESMALHTMNTDSAVPGLNRSNALSRTLHVLDEATLTRLMGILNPLWASATELKEENTRLTSVRDTLLPLLLSGRVLPSEVAA